MPRVARTVFAGIPHHITQRGNRGENVFYTDEDRQVYLSWLKAYCEKYQVEVIAYCLMTNHIHLILIPGTENGLQAVLKPLHMRYAQRLNREQGWKGHVWQGRFFSSPLDAAYLWAAIRYIERNPVRARMVRKAEKYSWSSAAAHCGLRKDGLLSRRATWQRQLKRVADWSAWLAEGDKPEHISTLRRNAGRGLPCGSDRFVMRLEKMVGRTLQCRPQGRPKKEENSKKG